MSESGKGNIRLASAIFLVVANMIGAGVFTTSGFSLGSLQSPFWVMLAWLVAGVIAICGAASYSALGVHFRESGGEYLFLSRTIHPAAGFVAGWISLIAGFTGPIALAAKSFAVYVGPLIFTNEILERPIQLNTIAVVAICFAAAAHGLHAKVGLLLQNLLVAMKLAVLFVLIGFALTAPSIEQPTAEFSAFNFADSLVWISFSYLGFNAIVYAASEIKNVERTLPIATFVGTSIVIVLYLLLNYAFVYKAPFELVVNRPDIAAASAGYLGGATLATIVRIVIGIALLTSVFAMIMLGPRVYSQMAVDGLLPNVFRDPSSFKAIAIQAVLAIVAVWVSSLDDLLQYLELTLSISSALSIATLFKLKSKGAELRIPFWPIPPIVFITATSGLAVVYSINSPWKAFASFITIAVGIVAYFLLQPGSTRRQQSK